MRGKRLLIILGIGIFYGLSEIILRLLGLPVWHTPRTYPSQFSPTNNADMVYVNLPDAEIVFSYESNPRGYFGENNSVIHRTNKYGFRGGNFSPQKPQNTFRAVFLGDSFTFGEGVRDQDTLPEQFAGLAAQKKIFGEKKIEAVNLGVGGYNTQQEWAAHRDFADGLSPDMVILSYGINDAEQRLFIPTEAGIIRRNREKESAENPIRLTEAPRWVKIFKIHQILWKIQQERQQTQTTINYYRSLYRESNPAWEQTREAIANLGKYGKQNNIKMVAVIFPLLFQLDNYPLTDEQNKVIAEFQSAGITVIDLLGILQGKTDQELWVHQTDQHPNEAVYAMAARNLAEIKWD